MGNFFKNYLKREPCTYTYTNTYTHFFIFGYEGFKKYLLQYLDKKLL